MRVYDPLMKYLDECGIQTVTLTYSEIEKIIGRELQQRHIKSVNGGRTMIELIPKVLLGLMLVTRPVALSLGNPLPLKRKDKHEEYRETQPTPSPESRRLLFGILLLRGFGEDWRYEIQLR